MARRLKAEELRAVCDPSLLPFRSTVELPPLEGMIGQDRALSATTFGIGMRHHGYNLFVLGPAATGKSRTMRRVLARTAQDEPTPRFNAAVEQALVASLGRLKELRHP